MIVNRFHFPWEKEKHLFCRKYRYDGYNQNDAAEFPVYDDAG